MFDDYSDIKSRIKRKPDWYDVHGVPRYGKVPDSLKPFIRRIKCQACHQVFDVCLVGGVYHTYMDDSFTHEPATFKVIEINGKMETVPDLYRLVYIEPDKIPDEWHYGDPPDHDRPDAKPDAKGWDKTCQGVTMNSIPEWLWGKPGYEAYAEE